MIWQKDAIELLTDLLRTPMSAGNIALQMTAKLACDISRCAVIGKASRLGLKLPGSIGRVAERTRHPKPRKMRFKEIVLAQPPPPVPTLICAPVEQLFPEDHQCKWPLGHPGMPGFGFCPEKKVEGKSYCAGHLAMAYIPTRKSPVQRPAYAF